MNEPIITMVYPANISQIWQDAEALLEPTIALAATHTKEGVYSRILGGQAQLWVQWEDKVVAAVVTEFKSYELGLAFNIWLAGAAKDSVVIWDKFLEIFHNFAEINKCRWLENCGREGWGHYAKDAEKIGVLRRIEIGGAYVGRG